jgi:hypothetical protein
LRSFGFNTPQIAAILSGNENYNTPLSRNEKGSRSERACPGGVYFACKVVLKIEENKNENENVGIEFYGIDVCGW